MKRAYIPRGLGTFTKDERDRFNKQAGALIKRARVAQDLHPDDLAEYTGIPTDTLEDIELYGQGVSLINAYKIARVLGVPMERFIPPWANDIGPRAPKRPYAIRKADGEPMSSSEQRTYKRHLLEAKQKEKRRLERREAKKAATRKKHEDAGRAPMVMYELRGGKWQPIPPEVERARMLKATKICQAKKALIAKIRREERLKRQQAELTS